MPFITVMMRARASGCGRQRRVRGRGVRDHERRLRNARRFVAARRGGTRSGWRRSRAATAAGSMDRACPSRREAPSPGNQPPRLVTHVRRGGGDHGFVHTRHDDLERRACGATRPSFAMRVARPTPNTCAALRAACERIAGSRCARAIRGARSRLRAAPRRCSRARALGSRRLFGHTVVDRRATARAPRARTEARGRAHRTRARLQEANRAPLAIAVDGAHVITSSPQPRSVTARASFSQRRAPIVVSGGK